MPRQQVDLVNGEIYHICYRAVGDASIFLNQDDYFRGIFSLYEFNNTNPVSIWIRRRDRIIEKKIELSGVGGRTLIDSREKFVEILAFCFMPNHIHLLLRQVKDAGITKFMKKIGGGYANFFNAKYKRKGHLFNQFKAIHVTDDHQLKTVVTYIHCNPISLIEPGWKDLGVKEPEKVLHFLENKYRWSSLWDYIQKSNFSSVTSRDFLRESIGQETMHDDLKSWITYKSDMAKAMQSHGSLFLE